MSFRSLKGFSLIELAVVLFIVSLLLGGLLVPLASQYELRNRQADLESLREIKEALLGFAIINGRLPGTDTNDDGVEDNFDSGSVTTEGFLPWATLGVDQFDAWGNLWRYRVDDNFSSVFTLATTAADNLLIEDFQNNALISTADYPVAIVYSAADDQDGDGNIQDGENETYEQNPSDTPTYQGGSAAADFDDITIWITRPLLFNRMVVSGTLP